MAGVSGTINDFIDEAAFQQFVRLRDELKLSQEKFAELATAATNFNNALAGSKNMTDLSNNVKNNAKAIESLNASMEAQKKSHDALIAKYNEMITVSQKAAQGKNGEIAAVGNLMKAQADLKVQIDALTKQQTELNAQLKAGTISQKQYDQAAKKITNTQKGLQNSIAQTNREIEASIQARIQANKEQTADIKGALKLQKRLDQLMKARERERISTEKTENAYEQMKAAYKEQADLAKRLGAEYFQLQKSGAATEAQLKASGEAFKSASNGALELHKGLFDIEQSTGQSQRNVGNYNALMFETNQLLREAPNFALSARTGLMALSNNLPMFADQFRNVSKEIDENTGKMKGWKGALKSVGAAILSWQTLLIVGITLVLQYGDEMGAFFSRLFKGFDAAKEAQRAYNKELKETLKTAGEQIGKLIAVQDAVGKSTLSHEELSKAIDDVNSSTQGSTASLSLQNITTQKGNEIIQERIALLIQKAKFEAQQKAITKAVEEEQEAQQKVLDVSKNGIKWWQKFYTTSTDVVISAISDLRNAQDKLTEQSKLQINSTKEANEVLEQQVVVFQKRIDNTKWLIKQRQMDEETGQAEILRIQKNIDALDRLIDKNKEYIKTLKEASQYKPKSSIDSSIVQAQIAVFQAPKGSQEREEAQTQLDKLTALKEFNATRIELEKKYLDENGKIRKGAMEDYKADLDLASAKYQDAISKAAKETVTTAKKTGKDLAAERKATLEAAMAAERDLANYKIQLALDAAKDAANADKAIVDDQTKTFKERYSTIDSYYEHQSNAITLSYNLEVSKLKTNQDKITQLRLDGKDREADALEEKTTLMLQNAAAKETAEQKKLAEDVAKQRITVLLSEIDEEGKAKVTALQTQAANEETQLNEQYANGEISREEYEKRKLEIVKKYNKEILEEQIKTAERLIDINKNKGIDVAEQEKELAELKKKLSDEETKHVIDNEDKKKEAQIKTINKIKEYTGQVMNIIGGLVKASVTAQLNELQEQQDALDKSTEQQIKAVQLSIGTEEEKAAKIAIIKANQAAQEARIEREKRKVKEREARFDKAKAVADIIMNTAVAITKLLGNPALAFLIPITAALGAAQLAVAVAQPIPKYYTGTESSQEGIAMVGERGSELMVTPAGELKMTPAKSTLTYLEKGTQIFDANKTRRIIAGEQLPHFSNSTATMGWRQLLMSNERLGERMSASVKEIPIEKTTFAWSERGVRKWQEKGGIQKRWVNRITG